MIDFSTEQKEAMSAAREWHRRGDEQIFRLFGYAGVGKTTIARALASEIGGETCYAAFTGKAALQMAKSGCPGAGTIHSLIYNVRDDALGGVEFILNEDSEAAEADLIVIDECSMVGEDLARDLMSFEKPILVLGDPAQLPPVDGQGFFTDAEPDVLLTEIHRQARDNPIIDMATRVRQGKDLPHGAYGHCNVIRRSDLMQSRVMAADQIICGRNTTRRSINQKMRRLLGMQGEGPRKGDRVICTRNDKTKGIFNGGMFTVCDEPIIGKHGFWDMEVLSEDGVGDGVPIDVLVPPGLFLGEKVDLPRHLWREVQQFDFGYAITAHKAQGSQWPDVIVFDESGIFREEANRWLYTAITRAAESITIVRGG